MVHWFWYCLSTLLLPLVVFQGKRLRKRIQRLPEALGPRKGRCSGGEGGVHILSIGESPFAGVGLRDQSENMLPALADRIAHHHAISVDWTILGETGIRLHELMPRFESELPSAVDVIVIGIGVNDCKAGTSMKQWAHEWNGLYKALKCRFPETLLVISSTPPMMRFPVLPLAVRIFLGCRSRLMNHILKGLTAGWHNVVYFPIPFDLRPDAFASDGFHPNAKSHQQWAEGVMSVLNDVNWRSSNKGHLLK